MATLQEQLAELLEQHDLTALTIVAHRGGPAPFWCSAFAQAADGICEQSDYDRDDKTPGKAIASALTKVAQVRTARQAVPVLVAAEPR